MSEGSEDHAKESEAKEGIVEERLGWRELYLTEDWWANWFAGALIVIVASGIVTRVPKIGRWSSNPLDAIPVDLLLPLAVLGMGCCVLTTIGTLVMKRPWRAYSGSYLIIFLLACFSYLIANQNTMKAWGGHDERRSRRTRTNRRAGR